MNPPTAAPDLPDAASDVPVADRGARSGTIQSIERAFGLLETMADHGGTMGLSQLASSRACPFRRSTGCGPSSTSPTCARTRAASISSRRG